MAISKDLDNDQWKINFMNELIYVVHQTSESGLSPKEAKDILWLLGSDFIFLLGIYFIIFVFVFFLIRNCMLCTPFILCYIHATLRHCVDKNIIIAIFKCNGLVTYK